MTQQLVPLTLSSSWLPSTYLKALFPQISENLGPEISFSTRRCTTKCMNRVRSQRDVRCSKIIWHKIVQEQSFKMSYLHAISEKYFFLKPANKTPCWHIHVTVLLDYITLFTTYIIYFLGLKAHVLMSKSSTSFIFEPGASGLPCYCTSIYARSCCAWRASSVDPNPKKLKNLGQGYMPTLWYVLPTR